MKAFLDELYETAELDADLQIMDWKVDEIAEKHGIDPDETVEMIYDDGRFRRLPDRYYIVGES